MCVSAYCLTLFFLFVRTDNPEGVADIRNERDFLILTNNPLVPACMSDRFEIRFFAELAGRDILVKARDLIYIGHTLYTHPLAGSVKPNETPCKSVVISRIPHVFSPEQAEIISNSIAVCDKFAPRDRVLSEPVLRDFQLIDYTLLAGAIDFDAAAGLSKLDNSDNK